MLEDWIYVAQGVFFEEMTKLFGLPFRIEVKGLERTGLECYLRVVDMSGRLALEVRGGKICIMLDGVCRAEAAIRGFNEAMGFMQGLPGVKGLKDVVRQPEYTSLEGLRDSLNFLLGDWGVVFGVLPGGKMLSLLNSYHATDFVGGSAGWDGRGYFCSCYRFKCASADIVTFLLQCRKNFVEYLMLSDRFSVPNFPHLMVKPGGMGLEVWDGYGKSAEAWGYFSLPVINAKLVHGSKDQLRVGVSDVILYMTRPLIVPRLEKLQLGMSGKSVYKDGGVVSDLGNRAYFTYQVVDKDKFQLTLDLGMVGDPHWGYSFIGSLAEVMSELDRIAQKGGQLNGYYALDQGSLVCLWNIGYMNEVLCKYLQEYNGLKVSKITQGVVSFENSDARLQYLLDGKGTIKVFVYTGKTERVNKGGIPYYRIPELCMALSDGSLGYALAAVEGELSVNKLADLVKVKLGYPDPLVGKYGNGWQVAMQDIGVRMKVLPCKNRYSRYMVTAELGDQTVLEYEGNLYDIEALFDGLRVKGLLIRDGILWFRMKSMGGGVQLKEKSDVGFGDGFEAESNDVQGSADNDIDFGAIDEVLSDPGLLDDFDKVTGNEGGSDGMVATESEMDEMLAAYEQEFGVKPGWSDTSDEEEDFVSGWRSGNITVSSVVPATVSQVRVVALVYEDRIFAYRFKTDVGDFDVTRMAASKYGLAGYKVSKSIRLQQYNGLYATKGEVESGKLIPDVSECDEDCKRLFGVLLG